MIQRILALLRKEFLAIFTNRQMRGVLFVPPIIMLFIFGYAVTMEIRNIDLGVYDKANTVESRELVSGYRMSPWFRSVQYYHSTKAVEEGMANRDVNAVLVIQEDFSKVLKSGSFPSVLLITDGRQMNSSALVAGYAGQIVASFQQGGSKQMMPLSIEVRHWFNPELNYTWTLMASLYAMLSTLSGLLLTAMTVAREKELGTFEQLIVSPLTPAEIVLGKTIPPFAISLVLSMVMIGILHTVFGLPVPGNKGLLLLSVSVALLALIGVAFFISSIVKTQQQALLGIMTFQMPAILLSGFISPVKNMPWIVQQIDMLNPMKYYMVITKGLLLKDMSAGMVFEQLIPLFLIACFTLSFAAYAFQSRME